MNGRAHGMATKVAAPVVAVVAVATTGEWLLGVAAAIGCLAGLIIDPDLDCNSTLQLMNASRWRMMRASWPIGYLWFFLWWPYSQLFPHRGLSHVPVLGTLTRLVYLAVIPLGILVALSFTGHNITPAALDIWMLVRPRLDLIFFAVCGLIVSDTLHWAMDGI